MASASWNHETKSRLNEKIAINMNDIGSLTRQVIRTSKSSDSPRLLVDMIKSYCPCPKMSQIFVNTLTPEVFDRFSSCLLLSQAAKNFASQENCILHTMENMKKLDAVKSQLEFHHSGIDRNLRILDDIQDQISLIQR